MFRHLLLASLAKFLLVQSPIMFYLLFIAVLYLHLLLGENEIVEGEHTTKQTRYNSLELRELNYDPYLVPN